MLNKTLLRKLLIIAALSTTMTHAYADPQRYLQCRLTGSGPVACGTGNCYIVGASVCPAMTTPGNCPLTTFGPTLSPQGPNCNAYTPLNHR